MWDIMGYPKMSNFTGKIWENMGKWWWTCGWNGVSYIFRWDCSHWELPSWLFCGTETPTQDIRRQTHDPKPALPGIRNPTLKSSSLTLQVASKMTGGLNSKTAGPPHHDPHEIHPPKSMLSCNYETEPALDLIGTVEKGPIRTPRLILTCPRPQDIHRLARNFKTSNTTARLRMGQLAVSQSLNLRNTWNS